MLLGICRRQVYRLLGRLRADGPEALVSWKRGRPSNRAFKAELRDQVLGLVRENYHDFGPTLAVEYLAERHQITISHETLTQTSEARRVGTECVRTCRSRWSPIHYKQQHKLINNTYT